MADRIVVVREPIRTVTIATPGPQGPPGAAGATGATGPAGSDADMTAAVGIWTPIFRSAGGISTAAAPATKYLLAEGSADIVTLAANVAGMRQSIMTYLDPALAPPGFTSKLRIRSLVKTGPSTIQTITLAVGLYPILAQATLEAGTVVAGSEATIANGAINAAHNVLGAEFTCPPAGIYVLAAVVSAAPTGNVNPEATIERRFVPV